jgi:ABC-type branched-subunit amino acid transport system substrate-binding protein
MEVDKVFREIRKAVRLSSRLIKVRQYFLLGCLLVFFHWLLFRPEHGFISSAFLGEKVTDEYRKIFSVIFLLELLHRIVRTSLSRKVIAVSASVIFLSTSGSILWEISNLPPPNRTLTCQYTDCISWGEHPLVQSFDISENQLQDWQKECLTWWRMKTVGTIDYDNRNESSNKLSNDVLSAFVKDSENQKAKCPNDPEAHVYLNNIVAWKSKNPIRIVVSVPISRKDGVEDSQEILRGVVIAQDEANKADIKGKKLLVGIADDGFEVKGDSDDRGRERLSAQNIASYLIGIGGEDNKYNNKDITGVVGPFSSDATDATASIYKKGGLVAISPTSTAIRKTDDSPDTAIGIVLNDWIFRTAPSDQDAVGSLIKSLSFKYKKIYAFYERGRKYSESFLGLFESEFENLGNGEKVIGRCDILRFDQDSCFAAIERDMPDALLLIPSTANTSEIIAKSIIPFNQKGKKLPLLGSDSMYDPKFVSVDNLTVSVPWFRDNAGNEGFKVKAKKYFDSEEISWRTAMAYDATKALIEGLKRSSDQCSLSKRFPNLLDRYDYPTCLRKKLRDVLSTTGFSAEGANSKDPIEFSNGERVKKDSLAVLVHTENGDFKPGAAQQ